MSNLYDIVQKVINTSDLGEASNALYGVDGININSDEYYNSIISTFIQKKETIIRKRDNKLIFDLNSCNDMWNIVFLGEYIKENDDLYKSYNHLLSEMEKINDQLKRIKDKHKKASTKEEHLKINEEYKKLESKFLTKKEEEKRYKGVIKAFYEIDWVKLENSNDELEKLEATKLLKQSINIIHKFRNSLAHGFDNEGKNLEINNENFMFSIPIEYLDGFNKGRIIASDDDKIVVEKTNAIISPIFEALEYDVYKIESFFYNVNPDYLGFLLEQVNYEYEKLYKLSMLVFSFEDQVRYFLKSGIALEQMSKFSSEAFLHCKEAIELHNKDIDISNLSNSKFLNFDITLMLYNAGIDVARIADHGLDFPEKTIKLHNLGVDVCRLPDDAFLCNHNDILFELYNTGIDMNSLPTIAYSYIDETIMFLRNGIDVLKLSKAAYQNPELVIEEHKKGHDVSKIDDNYLKKMEYGLLLGETNHDKLDPDRLSMAAIANPSSAFFLNLVGIDIYNLPDQAFILPDVTLQLFRKGIDVTKLPGIAFERSLDTINFFDKGLDVTNLPEVAFKYPKALPLLIEKKIDISKLSEDALYFQELVPMFIENGIDVNKLPRIAFYYPEATLAFNKQSIDINNLPSIAFIDPNLMFELLDDEIDITKLPDWYSSQKFKTENIKYILGLVENDYSRLHQFPIEFFTCDISLVDEMYKNYNLNVAKSIFGIDNPKLIASLFYCNNVFKKYQKDNGDCELVNLDCMKVIHSSFNSTYMYRKNIDDIVIDQNSYLSQFILDSGGSTRDYGSLKSNLLDKLRNSIVHFRFKPVKDNDGNIVENKVYLFDKYDNSDNNNFNVIMDINDLIEIARQVELDLSRSHEDFEGITKEENRFRAK